MMNITIKETFDFAIFDVVRVDFANEAVATSHPVELGAEVTDHVQTLPLRFTVEVIVTASSVSNPLTTPFVVQEAVSFFERALGKLLIVGIEGEGTFDPMVLEAFPHSRTNLLGRIFSLRFKHIRIASSLSVSIPPRMPAPIALGAATEQAAGQAAPVPAVPTSILFDLGDAGAGFMKAALGWTP